MKICGVHIVYCWLYGVVAVALCIVLSDVSALTRNQKVPCMPRALNSPQLVTAITEAPHGSTSGALPTPLRFGLSAQRWSDYGTLPASFEANRGQTDRRVKFLSRGAGYTLFLTPDEAVLGLRKPGNNTTPKPDLARLS